MNSKKTKEMENNVNKQTKRPTNEEIKAKWKHLGMTTLFSEDAVALVEWALNYMETEYKEFDIKDFEAGKKVFTRSGFPVTVLMTNRRGFRGRKIIACIHGAECDVIHDYSEDGKFSSDRDSKMDLVIKL